ncbi:MAG: WhiB family transcriptional regulator, partial [Acidimicrobiia bacterium]|nr:WhiB family transcriptional regulator [Acidimicrobiia bacterium]
PVGSSDEVTEALAKKTCSRCAVRADCLSYAMETNQSEGIWGGLTPRERRSLRRKERRRAAG